MTSTTSRNVKQPINISSLIEQEHEESVARAFGFNSNLTNTGNGLLRQHVYPRVTPWEKMFDRSYANTSSASTHHNASEIPVVCRWKKQRKRVHFPHVMEQLYRCFSLWQAHPHQPRRHELMMNVATNPSFDGFVAGYVDVLKSSFGVTVVPEITTLPNDHIDYPYGIIERPSHAFAMHRLEDAATLRQETLKFMQQEQEGKTQRAQKRQESGNRMLGGCPVEIQGKHPNSTKRLPAIGFLNRNKARHIDNHRELLDALRKKTNLVSQSNSSNPDSPVHYLEAFDGMSFFEQVAFMSQIDILVSPHGAQLTSVAYQPACGGLLEIFPKGYYIPEYFGSLAMATGHYYLSLYAGGSNITKETGEYMTEYKTRVIARKFHITARVDLVLSGIQELADRWQTCCERRQQEGTVESFF